MTAYLQTNLGLSREDADGLRMHYWHRYGATLLGLVRHHGTNPGHFLSETHRFESLDQMVVFNNAVKAMLRRLPGRKLVFSNGPRDYAESIVRYMGIRQSFDDVSVSRTCACSPSPDPGLPLSAARARPQGIAMRHGGRQRRKPSVPPSAWVCARCG